MKSLPKTRLYFDFSKTFDTIDHNIFDTNLIRGKT